MKTFAKIAFFALSALGACVAFGLLFALSYAVRHA